MNGLHEQAHVLKNELGLESLSKAFELLAKCHGFKTPNQLTALSHELNTVQANIALAATAEKIKTTYDARLNLDAVSLLELDAAQNEDPLDIAKALDAAAKKLKTLAKSYREGAAATLTAPEPKKLFLTELRKVKLDAGVFQWSTVRDENLEVSFRPKMGTVVIGKKLKTSEGTVTVGMLFSQRAEILDLKCVDDQTGAHFGEHQGLTEKIHENIRKADRKSIKIIPFHDLHSESREPVAFGVTVKLPGSKKEEFIRIKGSNSPFTHKKQAENFVKTIRRETD